MSNSKKSDTKTENPAKAKQSTGNAEVQAKVDKETAQGFRGTEVDPTPNENYTVAGVVAGKPTPETDPDSANTARALTNVGLTGLEAAAREKEITRTAAAGTRKQKRGK
jgi:hypothetical protein